VSDNDDTPQAFPSMGIGTGSKRRKEEDVVQGRWVRERTDKTNKANTKPMQKQNGVSRTRQARGNEDTDVKKPRTQGPWIPPDLLHTSSRKTRRETPRLCARERKGKAAMAEKQRRTWWAGKMISKYDGLNHRGQSRRGERVAAHKRDLTPQGQQK